LDTHKLWLSSSLIILITIRSWRFSLGGFINFLKSRWILIILHSLLICLLLRLLQPIGILSDLWILVVWNTLIMYLLRLGLLWLCWLRLRLSWLRIWSCCWLSSYFALNHTLLLIWWLINLWFLLIFLLNFAVNHGLSIPILHNRLLCRIITLIIYSPVE